MRNFLAIGFAVLAVAVLSLPASSTAAPDRCAPRPGERVVQASRFAELYRRHDPPRVVGCWRATGRRTGVWLPPKPVFDSFERLTFLKLDRRHVAVEHFAADRQGQSYALKIFDLRHGRRRHWVSPHRVERPEGGNGAVRELEITSGGSAVWIAACHGCLKVRLQVYKVDRNGMDELDAGPGVERGSLRLRDKIATWRSGNEARTARLQD